MENRLDYLLSRLTNSEITDEEYSELLSLSDVRENEALMKRVMDRDIASIEQGLSQSRQPAPGFDALAGRIKDGQVSAWTTRKKQKSRVLWGWIGTAAVVSLLVVAAITLYMPGPAPEQAVAIVQPVEYTGKQPIKLPDGTQVLLNDNSSLSYTAAFGNGSREVTLTGEAFFDVSHDPANPFIVHTGKYRTRVLGTAFNVKAYQGQEEITVTVTRGKVSVGDDEQVYEQLLPDEQLAVNTQTDDFEKANVDSESLISWKNDFLVLEDLTMADAVQRIADKYEVTVSIENEQLKNCIVSAAFFHQESVEDVLTAITRVMRATYRIQDQKVVIEGGVGCE